MWAATVLVCRWIPRVITLKTMGPVVSQDGMIYLIQIRYLNLWQHMLEWLQAMPWELAARLLIQEILIAALLLTNTGHQGHKVPGVTAALTKT
jgi:hypothetical protein